MIETGQTTYQETQTRLAQRLTRLVYHRSGLHHWPFKLGLALFLNSSLLWAGWLIWQQRHRPLLPAAVLLVLLWALRYKNAGLIQLVLGMSGLGLGYGYGSRFNPHKQPRAGSDYDLGVFASRPVRLHHKRDPRILLARAVLMGLTWRRVDLKQYPPSHFVEKEGVLLLALFLGRLLSPCIALLAWSRGLIGR